MKIGWGYKITILYVGFVLMMLTLVFMSVNEGVTLVTDNYYEKDLKYNDHILKLENSKLLDEDVSVKYSAINQTVTVYFPKQFGQLSGQIQFFRPSDDREDFVVDIANSDHNTLEVNSKDMVNGLWKMKIDWQGDGTKFYKEEILIIQQVS